MISQQQVSIIVCLFTKTCLKLYMDFSLGFSWEINWY